MNTLESIKSLESLKKKKTPPSTGVVELYLLTSNRL